MCMFWLNKLKRICSVSWSLTFGYISGPKKWYRISRTVVSDLLLRVLLSSWVFSSAVKKVIMNWNPPWLMKALQNSTL